MSKNKYMRRQALTVADMDAMAEELSHFEGDYPQGFDGDYPEGYDGYTGLGDPFVDFEKEFGHFGDAASEDRQFQLSITNTSTTTAGSFYLFSGLAYLQNYVKAPTNNGMMADGAFKSREGLDFTAAGSPGTIQSLQSFLFKNPSQLIGMKIVSTESAGQVNKQLTYAWESPFFDPGSRTIKPGNGLDQYVTQDKTVVFSLKGVVLNDQTSLLYTLNPNEVVTIDLYFGGSLNPGKALPKLANRAVANINLVGTKKVDAMARYMNKKGSVAAGSIAPILRAR